MKARSSEARCLPVLDSFVEEHVDLFMGSSVGPLSKEEQARSKEARRLLIEHLLKTARLDAPTRPHPRANVASPAKVIPLAPRVSSPKTPTPAPSVAPPTSRAQVAPVMIKPAPAQVVVEPEPIPAALPASRLASAAEPPGPLEPEKTQGIVIAFPRRQSWLLLAARMMMALGLGVMIGTVDLWLPEAMGLRKPSVAAEQADPTDGSEDP